MTPRPPRPQPVSAQTRSLPNPSTKALRRADSLAELFKILGNANRVKIMVFLDERERSVGEIEAALAIHQPTLSQQLGGLRDANLITGRRAAKSVIYSLTEAHGRRALEIIHLANGHLAARMPVQASARGRAHQAAGFASVLSARGSHAAPWQPGFKSLLQE